MCRQQKREIMAIMLCEVDVREKKMRRSRFEKAVNVFKVIGKEFFLLSAILYIKF
jgi:hypothetical protein